MKKNSVALSGAVSRGVSFDSSAVFAWLASMGERHAGAWLRKWAWSLPLCREEMTFGAGMDEAGAVDTWRGEIESIFRHEFLISAPLVAPDFPTWEKITCMMGRRVSWDKLASEKIARALVSGALAVEEKKKAGRVYVVGAGAARAGLGRAGAARAGLGRAGAAHAGLGRAGAARAGALPPVKSRALIDKKETARTCAAVSRVAGVLVGARRLGGKLATAARDSARADLARVAGVELDDLAGTLAPAARLARLSDLDCEARARRAELRRDCAALIAASGAYCGAVSGWSHERRKLQAWEDRQFLLSAWRWALGSPESLHKWHLSSDGVRVFAARLRARLVGGLRAIPAGSVRTRAARVLLGWLDRAGCSVGRAAVVACLSDESGACSVRAAEFAAWLGASLSHDRGAGRALVGDYVIEGGRGGFSVADSLPAWRVAALSAAPHLSRLSAPAARPVRRGRAPVRVVGAAPGAVSFPSAARLSDWAPAPAPAVNPWKSAPAWSSFVRVAGKWVSCNPEFVGGRFIGKP